MYGERSQTQSLRGDDAVDSLPLLPVPLFHLVQTETATSVYFLIKIPIHTYILYILINLRS